jgi:cobalt/nickel transport system permease protein
VRDSTVSEWARRSSALHRRNSACKLIALLIVLVAIATCPVTDWAFSAGVAVLLIGCVPVAALPFSGVIARAALVTLFAVPFVLLLIVAGDVSRAAALVMRTYSSAIAVVLYAGVTPVPETLAALRRLGIPPVLVEVIQFVYRYLFVIGEQARSMNVAAISRGAVRLKASAGAVAVLFARSYQRAEAVHRSMLSRGYSGDMPLLWHRPAQAADFFLVTFVLVSVVAMRVAAQLLSK